MQISNGTKGIVFGDPGPLRSALADRLKLPATRLEIVETLRQPASEAGATHPQSLPELGGTSIAVNLINHKTDAAQSLLSMGFNEFRSRLDDQIASPWTLIRSLFPCMRSGGGVIVNVLQETEGSLDLVKSLSMLTRCAALEGASSSAPIRVHALLVAHGMPIMEVVESVDFLCSDRSSFMSGNILRLGAFR